MSLTRHMTRREPAALWRHRYTLVDTAAPSEVDGLVAHYDFSDISTLFQDTARTSAITTDGQTILGVTDKSGTAHLSETTNGPTYKEAIQNSRSVARFDGTNDILRATAPSAYSTRTVFIVGWKRSAPSSSSLTFMEIAGGGAQLFTNSGDDATGFNWYQNEAGAVAPGVLPSATTPGVLAFRVNSSASLDFFKDGVSITNINPADNIVSGTTRTFGAEESPSMWGDYDFGEFVQYNSALSTANLNAVGNYLGARWGIPWSDVA